MKKLLKIACLLISLLPPPSCSNNSAETPPAVPVQIVAVQQATLNQTVTADAILFPLQQSAITPKISAPVKAFHVKRASRVHKGQLLATLENRDLAAAAQENKGAYEQAEAAYATTTAADLPQEMQKAQLDLQSAQRLYEAQQKVYDSRKDLYQQGAMPRKEFDQAGVDLTNARNQYEMAQKHFDALNAIGKQQTLKSAAGQLESAKGKFLGAEAQFSYSEILSPIDGVITDRPLYPGEMASANVPLLTVMDISQVIARAHIPQPEAALLKVGDKATITAPGEQNPVAGTVTIVSPALDPNSTTVEVWVQAKNPGQHLKPGSFIMLTLALLGGYLAFTIPISVFPTTNFPRILIAVDNGVMPIDQMMVTITRPVEEAVNSVPGLQQVRSITSRGSAEIDLFFDWNVDMFQTLQYVNAAISRVQPEIPPTATVVANRMTFASFPIIGYSLTSQTVPQTQLWEMATYEIKPRLNRLDGVSTVLVQGGQEPEFHVIPDPTKLLAASVTVTDILDSVRRTNLIDSPGLLEQNHQLVLGLVTGQVRTPEQIANTVIKTTPAGIPVRIGDVAAVTRDVKPVYTIVTANGEPAVLLNINRQADSNTVQVADEVHAEVERIRKSLPPGTGLRPFYDQSEIVSESIKSVRDAILIGLILASIILVVFLRDWGTSIVAALVIPVTVLVTFIALKLLGQSFNLMTLGGLAAAVGLVIDDAIVVVENIVLHRDAGQRRLQAIRSALHEIAVPLVGSTVTPIVVFLPLVAITGVTGTFFRALAATMAVSLLTSLALALTWTPNLSQYFIKPGNRNAESDYEQTRSEESEEKSIQRLLAVEEASLSGFFLKVVSFHERWLRRALQRPVWLAIFSVA